MSNVKILIVDDERSILDLLTRCLTGEGYEVDTASDGMEATEKVLSNEYNLIITDVMMPRLGGLDLLKNVKISRPKLPVVIITGYATTEITIEALKLGAVDFLTKPFKLSAIFFTVKKILDMQAREAEIKQVFAQIGESRKVFECTSREIDPEAIVQVIVRELIAFEFCTESDSIRVSLAIREAIENAVEHGNLELPSGHKHKEYMINPQAFLRWKAERLANPQYGDRMVRIRFVCSQEKMEVTVTDEGAGFDTGLLPTEFEEGMAMDRDLHGYNLMRFSMDEVRYNQKGNEVTLLKYRAKP